MGQGKKKIFLGLFGLSIAIFFIFVSRPVKAVDDTGAAAGAAVKNQILQQGLENQAQELDKQAEDLLKQDTGLGQKAIEPTKDEDLLIPKDWLYTSPDQENQKSQTTPQGTLFTNAFLNEAGFNPDLKIENGQDIRLYVVNLIKIVLTLVGFGFFVLIFIGGYLWMTAAGNEETIKKAKGIISKAIIGFAIILVSYALAVFVAAALVVSLQSATSTGQEGSTFGNLLKSFFNNASNYNFNQPINDTGTGSGTNIKGNPADINVNK